MTLTGRVLLLACVLLPPAAGPASASGQDGGSNEDARTLALGARVYKKHCRPCHMPGGKSRIKKLNLSDGQWNHGQSLEEIEKIVSEGIESTQMLPFSKKLSAEEINAVARYVKTLSKSRR